MNINRKKIGLLIICLGLFLIILIIYFGFLKNSKKNSQPLSAINSTPAVEQLPSSLPATPPPLKTETKAKVESDVSIKTNHKLGPNDLGKIAMAFASRLGSFSNQSGYNNIKDLELLMTKSMKDWAETYIGKLSEKYKNNGAFYGIRTHSLFFKVDNFNEQEGLAKITVKTQRQVQGENEPYKQNIDIGFKKVSGEWLVDNAYWLK